ncbi:hypothetical protein HK101_007569 [Irineochytrium annulatum]|nr:hypothetical protein HK101_007569 [Irineochytrium annulatum]
MDWRDDYTTDNETETFAVPADDFTEVYVECAEEGSAKAAVASDDCSETEASESSRTDEAHVISSRNSLVPETSASVVGVDEAGGESKHGCGFEAEQDEVVNVNTQGRGIVASEHLRRESVVETGGIEEDEEQKGASKVSAAGGEGPAEAVDGIETAIGEGEFYDEDGGASKEFRRNVKKVGDDFPKISPDLQVDDTSDGPDVKPEIHNPSADGEFIAKVDDTVLPKIRSACGEIMCQQQCDEARQQTLILSLEGAIVDVRVMAKFNEVVKVPGVTDGVASDEAEDLETKRKYEALEARDAAACEQGKNSKTEVDILDIEEEVAHGEPEVKTAKESETTAGFAHEEVEDSQGNGRRSWDPRGGFATAPIATQADQVNESLHSTKFALENGCIRNDSMAGSSPLVEIGLTTESPHREPSLEQCQAPPSSDIEDAGATSPEIRRQLTVPDVWIRKSNVVASQVVMDSHITKVDSDILAAQDATDVQIALADFSPTDESPPSQSESYDYKAYQSTSSDIDMPQVIVVAQSTDGQRDTMATQDADDFEATHENPQAEPVNQPDRDGHFDTPTVPSGELTGHFDDYNQEPLPAKIAVPAHQSSTSDDICRIEDAVKTIGVREVESYLIPPMEVDTISRVVDLTSPDRIDLTAENSDGEQACEQSHIPPSSDVVAPPPIIMHHRRPSTVFVRRRLASRAIATQILNDSQITQADYDFLSPLDASEFYVAPADPFAIKESSLRPSSAHRHSTISQWTVTGAQQRASNRSPFQLVVDLQSTPLKPEDPTGQGAYDSDITQADPPVADEPQSQLCGHGCVEGVREPTAEHTTQQAQSPCPDGAALTVTRRSTCDNTGPDIYYSEELEDDERADSASEVDGRISLSHLYYENTVAIGDMVIFNDGVQDADLNDEDDDATEGEPEPHDSIEISVHDAAKDINLVVIGTIAIAKDAMIQSEVVIAGAGAVQCETPLSTSHCKISAKALLRVNHETIAAATTRGSFNDDANSGIADSSGVGELRNDDGANNGLATQVVVEGLKATYRKSPKSVKERDLTPKSAKRRDTMPQSIKREDSKLDCLEPSTNAEEYTGTSAKVLNARPGNYGTEFTVLDITEARDPDTQKKTRDQGLESQESLDFFNISSYRTPKRGPRSYSQKIVGIPSDVRRVAQRDRRSAIPQSIQTQPANDGRDRRPWPKTATPRFYEELAESGDALTKLKIGLCYYKGSVVKQDYNRAAELFRDAADAGDVRAKFNLGVCYKMGQGVKRNLYKAAELYEEAAVAGDPHAKACLGNLYYKVRLLVYTLFRK